MSNDFEIPVKSDTNFAPAYLACASRAGRNACECYE